MLTVIETINVNRISHLTKTIVIVLSFRKFVQTQFANVFPFDRFDHCKAIIRLLSYRDVILDRFLLFVEHFSRKYEGRLKILEVIFSSLGVNVVSPFQYYCSLLRNVEHLV